MYLLDDGRLQNPDKFMQLVRIAWAISKKLIMTWISLGVVH